MRWQTCTGEEASIVCAPLQQPPPLTFKCVCIYSPSSHDHDSAESLRLNKVGEAVLRDGRWSINDELQTPRQITDGAALFHFKVCC